MPTVTTYVFSTNPADTNSTLTGLVDGSNTDFVPEFTVVASSLHAFINITPISCLFVAPYIRLSTPPMPGDTVYVWGSSEVAPSSGSGVSALTLMQDAATEIEVLPQGQSLSANDSIWIFGKLNDLIDSWNADNLFIYYTDSAQYPIITFSASYTIGPGAADIIASRPRKIISAWWIDAGGNRTQISLMDEYQFMGIRDTTATAAIPRSLHYKTTYPNGTIYLFPYPSTVGTLELFAESQLSEFTNTSTVYPLPPGYRRAIKLSLAEDIGPSFNVALSPQLAHQANIARMKIQSANIVIKKIETDLPIRVNHYTGFMDRGY